jgi:hypothetical protein
VTNEEYIKQMERDGELDPNCKTCVEVFYPKIKEGKRIGDVFAPRHKALRSCRSGRYPHCTCDSCF